MCKTGADLHSHIKLNTSNMGILLKIEDFEGGSSLTSKYLAKSLHDFPISPTCDMCLGLSVLNGML